ncbi:GNAT family N-acetyltransferase [Spongiimicrobium salis]|uniref:GNAT family N-acetyltransferase n=1 Tax=Spongiimicrobium salis TaxID=1667022 RepID=UPI00374DC44C
MRIEEANNTDAQKLTQLTIQSKSYWGYPARQIEEWKDELTITASYIATNEVYKIGDENNIMGFYAYEFINSQEVKLNFLFIDPAYIGKGLGKILMNDFLDRIAKDGYKSVTLDADPNAENFYAKQGFRVIGQLQSSIKDRFLPIMYKEIGIK